MKEESRSERSLRHFCSSNRKMPKQKLRPEPARDVSLAKHP